jgi:thiopurine S-methyltransferase
MTEDWLSRWHEGRIGWHEAGGNAALRQYWPEVATGARVLVPLCGKTPDLLWLADQGLDVTGVELSEIAVRAFFDEAGLPFEVSDVDGLGWYRSAEPLITIVCGDYFKFSDQPFDALYDRASLIALPPAMRPEYVRHTKSLLKSDAAQLLVTLEYDQQKVAGPPFSVQPDEVRRYWGDIQCIDSSDCIESTPPKFRDGGLSEVIESVWIGT